MNHQIQRILIAAAVDAERDAILRGIGDEKDRFDVIAAGVGPAAAAAGTAFALASGAYDLVISMGIGGGFASKAEIGSLVVASEIIAADLGAETPEGYIPLDELGFGSARIPVEHATSDRIAQALDASGYAVSVGPIVTVSTVTGTAETAETMTERVPGVCAEAMEGFGVATAARLLGVPAVEIRAVSNLVGPRDRSTWRIKEALDQLTVASAIIQEVLA